MPDIKRDEVERRRASEIILRVMGLQQQRTPLLICDNLSAVCLTANLMFHKRTKHFDVDYHYVWERVALKALEVKHILASLQLADVFTKSLGQEAFFKLRGKLGVASPPSPSLRGCISLSIPNTLDKPEASVIADGPSEQSRKHNTRPTNDALIAVVSSTGCSRQEISTHSCRDHRTKKPTHSEGQLARDSVTFNRFECLGSCDVTCQ